VIFNVQVLNRSQVSMDHADLAGRYYLEDGSVLCLAVLATAVADVEDSATSGEFVDFLEVGDLVHGAFPGEENLSIVKLFPFASFTSDYFSLYLEFLTTESEINVQI
jgi:hypothetical protein